MNGATSTNPLLNREAIIRAIADLRKELGVLQERLGTPDEHSSDVDRASEIVHKINNLTAAMALIQPR